MHPTLKAEMTIDQANAAIEGLDLSSRIMMGQITEIATMARSGKLFVRDDAAADGCRAPTMREAEEIEDHARAISRILGHGGGSFGIGSAGTPLQAKRQYETKKAMAKAIADHRDPGGMTVHHDGVTVRYTPDPAPTAVLDTDTTR